MCHPLVWEEALIWFSLVVGEEVFSLCVKETAHAYQAGSSTVCFRVPQGSLVVTLESTSGEIVPTHTHTHTYSGPSLYKLALPIADASL